MKKLGIKHYRFSVAWPRLLPNGTLEGGINEKGLQFYDELIDALLAAGIQPFLTLYHWDLPSALQTDALPGWLDRSIVSHFVNFATLCFRRWGRKVSRWATFNEPWTFVVLGYGTGSKAPGGRWAEMSANPYTAGHNVLLAHAAAVRAFRQYAAAGFPPHAGTRDGADDPMGSVRPQIGITNNMDWREPLSSTEADVAAAERSREWWLGWFCDPIWQGDYPTAMREALGDRLPTFTDEEKAALVGSADFFG
jgi:beta-glucosidase